jgi:hypothetical protein
VLFMIASFRYPAMRRMARCAFLGVAAVLCATASVSDAKDPDLAEITRALNEWRASFVNIRVVWEMRNPEQTKARKPHLASRSPADDVFRYARQHWAWADHGLYRFETEKYDEGQSRGRDLDIWNAPKAVAAKAIYRREGPGPEMLDSLVLRGLGASQPTSFNSVVPLGGLFFPASVRWLGEMLAESETELEGFEDVGGERCARVAPAKLEGGHVWLDLRHGCLVRRYDLPDIPKRRNGSDFMVQEFQRLDSGLWFPKRGTLRMSSDAPKEMVYWEVTEVAVNQPLDERMFEPPAPMIGTSVRDERTRQTYRFGEKPDRLARVSKMVEDAQKNVPAGSLPPSAAIPASGVLWWSLGLLVVSGVLLTVGVRFWRKW